MSRYEVVAFSGWPIRPPTNRYGWRGGVLMTDFHVVDERGRTVKRFASRDGSNNAQRRRSAELCAERLNAQ